MVAGSRAVVVNSTTRSCSRRRAPSRTSLTVWRGCAANACAWLGGIVVAAVPSGSKLSGTGARATSSQLPPAEVVLSIAAAVQLALPTNAVVAPSTAHSTSLP